MVYTGVYGKDNSPSHYPLLSSKYDIFVTHRLVTAHLHEVYESQLAQSLIHYVFFLPPEAALVEVQAQIGQRRTAVALKTVEEAKRLFKTGAQVRSTIEVQQLDVNLSMFQIVLGHIQKGENITIKVEYHYIMATDITDNSFHLDVPIGRALFDPQTHGTPPTGTRTVFISPTAPAGKDIISIEVHLNMPGTISRIMTPSHPQNTTINKGYDDASSSSQLLSNRPKHDDSRANVLFGSKTSPTENFILIWDLEHPIKLVCQVESFSGTPQGEDPTIAFVLDIVSKFEFNDRASQDFLFLVDCGASMAKRFKAQMANEAVKVMLQNLPSKSCTFNIFQFTTNCTSVLPGNRSVPYDKENLNLGVKRIPKPASKNIGGKDINSAIRTAVNARDRKAVRTAIILVTDGLDWDSRKAVQLISSIAEGARKQQKWIRLFVLGIGDQVPRGICEALARAGAGATAYIPEDKVTELVIDKCKTLILSIGLAPLEVVNIKWPINLAPKENPSLTGSGLDFTRQSDGMNDPNVGARPKGGNIPPPGPLQASPNPRHLFWALQSTWYIICRGKLIPGRTKVNVTVNVPIRGPDYKQILRVDLIPIVKGTVRPTPGRTIHSLAAHSLIKDLEQELLSGKVKPDEKYTKEAEISRLGLRYNVISSQTTFVSGPQKMLNEPVSFISLPESAPGSTDSQVVSTPSDADIEHGWSTMVHNKLLIEPAQSATPSSAQDDSSLDVTQSMDFTQEFDDPEFSADSNGAAGDNVPLHAFLRFQSADGSFSPEITARVFPSSTLPPIPPALSTLSGQAVVKESIWITIIAIFYLEKKYAEESWGWDRAKINALKYVSSQLGTTINLHGQRPNNILTRLRASADLYVSSS